MEYKLPEGYPLFGVDWEKIKEYASGLSSEEEEHTYFYLVYQKAHDECGEAAALLAPKSPAEYTELCVKHFNPVTRASQAKLNYYKNMGIVKTEQEKQLKVHGTTLRNDERRLHAMLCVFDILFNYRKSNKIPTMSQLLDAVESEFPSCPLGRDALGRLLSSKKLSESIKDYRQN